MMIMLETSCYLISFETDFRYRYYFSIIPSYHSMFKTINKM